MTQPTYDLLNFRFYEDDGISEATQTALGTGNNQSMNRETGTDNRFCVRVELYNDNNKAGVETWTWEYSYDSGAWTAIGAASSVIRVYDSSILTDGEDCTQRLSSSTPFLTVNEGVDETGEIASVSVGAGNYLENLLSCYIIDADVADAKTIDIRVVESSGDTITYTNTPGLMVVKVVLTQVYKDIQAKWDMAELVGKELQVKYDMFELIGKELQAKWDIFDIVGKSIQAKWDITELVGKSLQAIWDMSGAVGKSLEAVWDILSSATQVYKDIQIKWDIDVLVTKSVEAKWDIRELIGKELQAVWDITTLVGKSLQGKWDILNLITKSIEIKWDILNLVTKSVQAVWDMYMYVNKSIQMKWDILNGAPPDEGSKRSLRQMAYRWTSRMGR